MPPRIGPADLDEMVRLFHTGMRADEMGRIFGVTTRAILYCLARRGLQGQGSWPRAQRASSSDSSRLYERSDRRERSEFGDGAMRPSIAGESARSADRRGEAP